MRKAVHDEYARVSVRSASIYIYIIDFWNCWIFKLRFFLTLILFLSLTFCYIYFFNFDFVQYLLLSKRDWHITHHITHPCFSICNYKVIYPWNCNTMWNKYVIHTITPKYISLFNFISYYISGFNLCQTIDFPLMISGNNNKSLQSINKYLQQNVQHFQIFNIFVDFR